MELSKAINSLLSLGEGAPSKSFAQLLTAVSEVLAHQLTSSELQEALPASRPAESLPPSVLECMPALRAQAIASVNRGEIVSAQRKIAIMLAFGADHFVAQPLKLLAILIRERGDRLETVLLARIGDVFDRDVQDSALNKILVGFVSSAVTLEAIDLSVLEREVCIKICKANAITLGVNPVVLRRSFRANIMSSAKRAETDGEMDKAERALLDASLAFPEDEAVNKQLSRLMIRRADNFFESADHDAYIKQVDKVVAGGRWAPPHFRKLSRQLIKLREFDRARSLIEASIARQDIDDQVIFSEFSALSAGLRELGSFEEIFAIASTLRQHFGDHPALDHAESLVHLHQGDFVKGWQLMRSRVLLSPLPPLIERLPRWDGQAHVPSLLAWITAGPGIGGEVMRLIFIKNLLTCADKIGVVCDERLHPALRRAFPSLGLLPHHVLDSQDQLEYSHWIDLISLPGIFAGNPKLPIHALLPDADRVTTLGDHFAGTERPRCGMSWFTTNAKSRRRRSLPDALTAHILKSFPEIDFVSLQHGLADSSVSPLAETSSNFLVPLIPERDTEGLLAIVSMMDVVVTIDNSVAHFAGALNVPTVLMLSKMAESQWSNDGSTSPLYPSIHILRQTKMGVWDDVVDCVNDVLRGMLNIKLRTNKANFVVST